MLQSVTSLFNTAMARLQPTYDRFMGEPTLITPMLSGRLVAPDPTRSPQTVTGIVTISEGVDKIGSARGNDANVAALAIAGTSISYANSAFASVAQQPRDGDQMQLTGRPGAPVYIFSGPGIPDGQSRTIWKLVSQP